MSKAVSQRKLPTVKELVAEQIRGVTLPMPMDVLIARVLQQHPSKAKNPRAAVRTIITEQVGQLLVYTDREHVLPMGVAMQGTRFRIPLSQLELDEGGFVMDYLRYYTSLSRGAPVEHQMKLHDAQGVPLPTQKRVYVKTHRNGLFGEYTDVQELLDVKQWLSDHAAQAGDYIIFTIEDWDACVVRLAFERAADAPHAEIAQRDQQLCDLLFDLLEHDRNEQLFPYTAIPTALVHLPDQASDAGAAAGAVAGHHWQLALRLDGRMVSNEAYIGYADAAPLFLKQVERHKFGGKPFAPEQSAQTYRFSAQLKRSKRKPVIVGILGQQTFFELDQALRQALGLDTWDHLGGFWLLISRANGRFREVEIGACAPDADYQMDGSASGVAVAGVGLAVGSRMKYVYDFGDWVEHELVVEGID